MVTSKRLAAISDSHFGKTTGHKVEHGPLLLTNMAVGIPDGETPEGIIEHFFEAIRIPENQKYGAFHGKGLFRGAAVDFYQRQYNVTLDKEDEVCISYGTKNGLVALSICAVNPEENVLFPGPGYMDYLAGVILTDTSPVPLNLGPPDYLLNWDNVDKRIPDNTMLVYLTYPNNSIGSTATKEVSDEAIERFKGTKTKIVYDFVYSVFDFDAKNPGISVPEHGKDVAIEIFSLSKGYDMSGFGVGLAIENKDMIQASKRYQTRTDTGMSGVLQDVATYVLNHYDEFLEEQDETFKRRRDKFETKLSETHLPLVHSRGGIYSWLRTPPDCDSETFEQYLLKEKSILVAPGISLGGNGKHHVRTPLVLDDKWLEEAASRLMDLADMYKVKHS